MTTDTRTHAHVRCVVFMVLFFCFVFVVSAAAVALADSCDAITDEKASQEETWGEGEELGRGTLAGDNFFW